MTGRLVNGVASATAEIDSTDWDRITVSADVTVDTAALRARSPLLSVRAWLVTQESGSSFWSWGTVHTGSKASFKVTGQRTGLTENTTYKAWVVLTAVSHFTFSRSITGDPDNLSTVAYFGAGNVTVFDVVSLGSTTTPLRSNPRWVTADPQRTGASFRAWVDPQYTGTLYWRLYLAEDPNSGKQNGTVAVDASSSFWTWTVTGLTQNRKYVLEASRDSSYATKASVVFTTLNITIFGVVDPSAEMGQFANLWRLALGLTDFDMYTGDLPAGYADPKLADDPTEMRVSALLGSLARRCSSIAVERSDGSWRLLRRDLLAFCLLGGERQTVDERAQTVLERTNANERPDAAVTEYSFTSWGGRDGDAVVTVGSRLDDPELRARYGERSMDVARQYVLVAQVPGSLDAIRNDLALEAPEILDLRMTAHNDGTGLWAAEPGECVVVLADGLRRVCTVLSRGLRFAPGGVGEHRLQCWVNASEPYTPPSEMFKLLWESGGDVELEDGSLLLLEA